MGNRFSLTQMNELERRRVVEEYLQEFIVRTNDGRLFTGDRSTLDPVRTKLTSEETNERDEWRKTRSDLETYYRKKRYSLYDRLKDLTVQELLLLRVAPPTLSSRFWISPRSIYMPKTNRVRFYPGEIYAWVDFDNEVQSFTAPAVENVGTGTDVLDSSLYDSSQICEEVWERLFISKVLHRLQTAGLLKQGNRVEVRWLKDSQPFGNAQHFLIAGRNKAFPIGFKATHNLLVPENAVDTIHRYKAAVRELKTGQTPTTDWINIGQPLAQVISCMFLARRRFGGLSSGTRSYFFKVEVTDGVPSVFITGAWFVGQKDYLRAWSYFYSLANDSGDLELRDGGLTTWPTWTAGSTPDRDQQGRLKHTEGREGTDDSPDERPPKSRKLDDQDVVMEADPQQAG